MKIRLTRRWGVAIALMVAVALVVWGVRRFAFPKPRPNIVLISIDTCRADYLSCYGYPKQTTPCIDRFAQESVLFEHCVSPVPLTLPAHCTMLTGTTPAYHDVHHNIVSALGDPHLTLPEILKNHRYETAAFISASVLDREYGLVQGFDTYDDYFREKIHNTAFSAERRGGETSRYTIEWLDQPHPKPFFLFVHYYDPHLRYDPPEPFASQFPESPYAGEIAYADSCVEQVFEKLQELGLYDEALVIVTGDHGEMLGEHGEPDHTFFIYQSALHVPLLIKLPGETRSDRIGRLVGLVDIVPTICRLLRIEAPGRLDGDDLTRWLRPNPPPDSGRRYYCESLTPTRYHGNCLTGLVTPRWKYIRTTRPELYDLIEDPDEARDLVDARPEIADELEQALADTIERALRDQPAAGSVRVERDVLQRLETIGYAGGGQTGVDSLESDPSKDDPKDLIGFHAEFMRTQSLIMDKRYDEAVEICRRLLAERPGIYDTTFTMAMILKEQGDLTGAVDYLTESLELEPNLSGAHELLAMVYMEMGDLAKAVRHFRRELDIQPVPNPSVTHNNLGYALMMGGRMADAIEQYEIALRLNPRLPKAHGNIGNALIRLGRIEEALRHFQQAMNLDPLSAEARNDLGTTLLRLDRVEEAVQSFREALDLDPTLAPTWNNLGYALMQLNKPEEAIEQYRKALAINPALADTHRNLAAPLAARGDLDEAIVHLREAVQLEPNFAEAHNELGILLAGQGDYTGAADHFAQAVRIRPDFGEARENLKRAQQLAAESGEE